MATLKGLTRSKRSEALSKGFVVDTVRGVLRVRKWPRKRGTPKSELQRWWIDWFRQANRLAKYVDGMSAARAIEITKNSGMYPRDVLLAAMRGRLYIWQDSNGKVWYPMAAVQDISESLDVLAQTVGSVLVRAADRWRSPPAGVINQVLTLKGSPLVPDWATPAGGGGLVQEVVAGSPIVPDNTVSFYDIDVSLYSDINIQADKIGFASSDRIVLRFSLDGGTTFEAGASDYSQGIVNASADAWQFLEAAYSDPSGSAATHNAIWRLTNLRAGRPSWQVGASDKAANMLFRAGMAEFDGPVTDIRIMGSAAKNFNAGTFRIVGTR